jgi:hypothetical protein
LQIAQWDRAQSVHERRLAESLPTTRTPEFDFLLASVRRFFHPESPLPSKEGLDWSVVLSLAYRHAVAGFLRHDCDAPALADGTREIARSTLAISAELVSLADLFKEEMIDVVPLKGPVLGFTLYRDKAVKTSTDLDLLVRPRDALRAKRLLESIGYRLKSVPHWPAERAYLRNINNELSFDDPALWLKLDLHWSLLPGYFPSPFDDANIWANLRSVPWGSTHLQILSSEQQLMFLCAHGVKHLWARLGWLCDLARLIQVEPGIDWSEAFDQTRRSHTTRMVLVSLLLADNLLGVELPPAAAALVDANPQARVLAATVLERLRTDRPASHVATATFCVRALERTSQRARLVFGMFLQPTEAEYRVVQMPPALYWTYYLFRPLRLAAKYIRRLGGNDAVQRMISSLRSALGIRGDV